MLDEAAFEEAAQHALDHGAQRAVELREAMGPDPQQLLEVGLDEAEQRGLACPPGAVDARANLHGQPPAGGRGTGCKEETELPSPFVCGGWGTDAGRQYRARRGQTGLHERGGGGREEPRSWTS